MVRIIEEGLKKSGKSKTGLARALGVGNSTISDMLATDRKPRQIKAKEWPKIREYLELEPMVKVVGWAGAGSEAHFYGEAADDPQEYVTAPSRASPETVAVEIRGDSLGPGFNGWLAFYDDRRDPITEDLYGRLCIVGLKDGRVLIKIPRPAKHKGYFHLHSSATTDVIPDVQIVWAARVRMVEGR